MTTAPASYNPSMVPLRQATAMGLRPGGKIAGRARIPGSKSEGQRAIVAAALAHGTTAIVGLPDGADVRAALALVDAAGARVEDGGAQITGVPPSSAEGWSAAGPVSAGESGTLARFATAAFALCGKRGVWQEIQAEGSLRSRRSSALFSALRAAGAEIVCAGEEGAFPVRVRATEAASQVRLIAPRSSQEVSALWLALAARPGPSTLVVDGPVPSHPYLELTRRTLAVFGAQLDGPTVTGPLRAPAHPIAIEPDASSAAVLLAAARLSGGHVEIHGLPAHSAQPDAHAAELIARIDAGGADVDLSGSPDLAPVLAAVAAAAALRHGASSRLRGLATLPGKESSRIEVLARGLESLGLAVRAGTDALEIGPGATPRPAGEVRLDPAGDHRMAFAFALLGLVADGVWVLDPACVAKSWPGFWDELARLGAQVATSA